MKNVAVSVVLKGAVRLTLTKLPKSKIRVWGEFQKYMYSDMSLIYSHRMPFLVGSAVEVLHTSVSPKYMSAILSNWRPRAVTVKFMLTLLNSHLGGVYWPTRLHEPGPDPWSETALTDERCAIAIDK